jgi:hypothetical protein
MEGMIIYANLDKKILPRKNFIQEETWQVNNKVWNTQAGTSVMILSMYGFFR